MRTIIVFALVSIVSLLFGDVGKGRAVYEANCAQCHSIHMTGGLGRDFNLVSYTRTKKEIKAYVRDPSREYRKFGYSANAMPTLILTPEEIENVADFIDSLQPFKKWMVTKK
ncbi:cytochrome c [Hydrogenimonas sp. SS33]|uniref:c-type cytochrome n=1 Tax=Hydrogenimonas leucolamina TaxID=2954236 RepID=UPI00336BE030